MKSDRIHCTLRHHSYKNYQPSGHYHSDAGSFTLAVDGIPVFVDPGTFIYTPSASWRNKFRSARMHNTFGLAQREPITIDQRLFTLSIPENSAPVALRGLSTYHDLYAPLRAHRSITFEQQTITVADSWESNGNREAIDTCWNFIVAPDIHLIRDRNELVVMHNDKRLLSCTFPFEYNIADEWYSPAYGIKLPTKKITMHAPLGTTARTIFTF